MYKVYLEIRGALSKAAWLAVSGRIPNVASDHIWAISKVHELWTLTLCTEPSMVTVA